MSVRTRARVSEHRGDCGGGRRVTCRRRSRAYASAAHVTAARNHTARGTRGGRAPAAAGCPFCFRVCTRKRDPFRSVALFLDPATYIRLIDGTVVVGGEQSVVTITGRPRRRNSQRPEYFSGLKKNYRFAAPLHRPLLQDEKFRNTLGNHVKGRHT